MQLSWMILLVTCLLAACGRGASDPDGKVNEGYVGRRRVRLRPGSRWRQRDDERVTSENKNNKADDESKGDRMNSYDGESRRPRINSDNDRDGEDTDEASKSRIKVVSASFRRVEEPDLRSLHDPTLTDDDLNGMDDHNIENELNALAEGLSQNNPVKVENNHNDDGDDNYAGLGFGDAEQSFQNGGAGAEHDYTDNVAAMKTEIGPPWSDWRHCNVSCGVGKQSRWRRCRDDSNGVCNRMTGRQTEWRRCLGMECDQKTIQELGGGCKDQLLMQLLLGVLIGGLGSVTLSAIVSFCYTWCKKASEWKFSDLCPNSCTNCCTGCGESCTDCGKNCCDPYTGCCAGCGGPSLCCWCLPCCDPYAQQDRLYYHKQLRMNNAYQLQHHLGPPGPGQGPGPGGKMPYKRPPAPLPRESTKRKPYYDEPDYAEIDQMYKDSPRKKQKEKEKYVKFTKKAVNQYQDSADEGDVRPTRKRAQEKVENDYIDILGDDDVENAYLTPTMRGERYESDFDAAPMRPR